MPLVNSNQFGAQYIFGFQSTDAPTITGFVARQADLNYEAETFAQAQDGEGLTESVVTTKPDKRKITGAFSGYILAGYSSSTIAASFTFLGRFYIVKSVSEPRKKGEFVEAVLNAESYALVTN